MSKENIMSSNRWVTRIGALALTALLAAGLGACGDDDDDEGGAATTTTPAATQQGAPAVDVTMAEYAYTVSGPLTAGGTLRVRNTGEELHVMALGKMKPGVTLDQIREGLLSAGPEGEGGDEGEGEGGDDGGSTADPGDGERRQTATTTTTSGTGTSTTSTLPGDEEDEGDDGEEGEEGGDPFEAFFEDEPVAPGPFLAPGAAIEVTAPEMGAGQYAMLCFIPVAGGGPPHFVQGMINELAVVEGPTPPPPTPNATYTMTQGKPIEGPETLSPGRQVLKFEAEGEGADELEPTMVKPDAGKSHADFEQVFRGLETPDGEFAVPENLFEMLPGDITFFLLDFDAVREVYVGLDLTAGNYELTAPDTDDEEEPLTPEELIKIKVE